MRCAQFYGPDRVVDAQWEHSQERIRRRLPQASFADGPKYRFPLSESEIAGMANAVPLGIPGLSAFAFGAGQNQGHHRPGQERHLAGAMARSAGVSRVARMARGALLAAALCTLISLPAGAQQEAGTGTAVYDKWCTPCHGDGPGKPGTDVLRQRYEGRLPALLEERTDMTAEYLRTFVRGGVGVMPQFRKTEITDSELDAMIDYLVR